jgi:hypothetical protein
MLLFPPSVKKETEASEAGTLSSEFYEGVDMPQWFHGGSRIENPVTNTRNTRFSSRRQMYQQHPQSSEGADTNVILTASEATILQEQEPGTLPALNEEVSSSEHIAFTADESEILRILLPENSGSSEEADAKNAKMAFPDDKNDGS